MAEKSLDQYRQEIQAYMDMEYTQAQMRRALQERYGIEVARSTLSDYIKALSDDVGGRASPEGRAIQEEDAKAAIMQAAGGEIIDRLAEVLEGLQLVKREAAERHGMDADQVRQVHDALEQHTRQFEALYGTFRGAVLCKIWLRALLVTGAAWGVVAAAVYGYFWGLPF
jgi:hypothetical protein